jgi:hypothetical protein
MLMTCTRWAATTRRPCQREAALWPAVPGEPERVVACWSHLTGPEREACRRARDLVAAERAKIWQEGQPERDRLAAEAEREQQAKLATCPCQEGLPQGTPGHVGWWPDAPQCAECRSWLCASCERVRVKAEAGQCEACRPSAKDSPPPAQTTGPFFLITLGGLENFEFVVQLLIRAGARNGGQYRVLRVDTPLGESQREALRYLEEHSSEPVTLTFEPGTSGDTEVRIDPAAPQPDLSGLGDIETWWFTNGYPSARR